MSAALAQALEITDADPREAAKAWEACGCEALDPGLALVVFDAAIIHGPERVMQWLRRAEGETADPNVLLTRVQAQRTHYEASRFSTSQDEMPAG